MMVGLIVPELMLIISLIINTGLQSNIGNQPMKMCQMKKKELWIIIEPTKEEMQLRLNLDTCIRP